jgi:hypothetical protein
MIPNIFKKQIQVIRKQPGYYEQDINSPNLGLWQNGQEISFTIQASVQPAPGEITQILPEGYRNKSSYLIYTDTELFCSEEDETNPDIVILYNKKYFILKKKIYDMTYLSHFELIAVQLK